MVRLRSVVAGACVALLSAGIGPVAARQVTDMAGATVTVPDGPVRVVGYNPPISYFVAVVAPDALVALNRDPTADERRHLSARLLALPVIGSWFDRMNKEALVALHPDVVLIEPKGSVAKQAESELATLGIAAAQVRYDRLDDIAPLFRFLGQMTDRTDRGEALAVWAEGRLTAIDARVAAIPRERRPRVYYAQGSDGLETVCAEGTQLEVTVRAGGVPVVPCGVGPGRKGRRAIALDEVIALQPDVIFATDKAFAETVRSDPRWQVVKAVADGRVYVAPVDMGGWIDKPPLFTRLLGLTWVYAVLYQTHDQGAAEIAAASAEFFRLFFGEP